jgi:cytochrome b561
MPSAPLDRYTAPAVVLHWLLAVLIVGMLALGVYMAGLPFSPQRLRLINWHKWTGIVVLVLSAARLLWRLTHRPPPLTPAMRAAMPGWRQPAHRLAHALLYLLFFATPLAGWAYSSAAGFPVVWFGVLPLPDLVPVDAALADRLYKPLHQACAASLAVLVALHVAAALAHHWLHRDGLLGRMVWRPRPQSRAEP